MRFWLSPSIAAACVLLAPAARAQPAPPPATGPIFRAAPDAPPAPPPAPVAGSAVRLVYTAPQGCADERELRSIVASTMGHDPFASGPTAQAHVVRVQIARQAGAFVGTVQLLDPSGRVLWSRPPLAHADCQRLVSVFGSVSIRAAIDTAPPSAAPARPIVVLPPAPPSSPQQPPPPAEPPAPRLAPGVRLGARAGVTVGVLPGPAAAFSGDVGISLRNFSLNLEGTATLPTERDVDAGVQLRTSYAGAALVPCGHYGWFVGCGVFSVGAMRAEAVNVTTAAQTTGIHVAAGLRAALEWPIVPAFALRVSVDGLVNLHPLAPQVGVGATPADAKLVEVWRSGPFATVLGAGVVVRFGGSPPAGGAKEPHPAGAAEKVMGAGRFPNGFGPLDG